MYPLIHQLKTCCKINIIDIIYNVKSIIIHKIINILIGNIINFFFRKIIIQITLINNIVKILKLLVNITGTK